MVEWEWMERRDWMGNIRIPWVSRALTINFTL